MTDINTASAKQVDKEFRGFGPFGEREFTSVRLVLPPLKARSTEKGF